jgi:4-amino-4-deoxy-L-arabinose transferase-like glycosyltransferase
MHSTAPFNLRRIDYALAILIVLFAFVLRVVVIVDRAYGDPQFAPLPEGSDQRTYVTFAEWHEEGIWPDAPFRYQPGFVYFLVAARALVGTSLAEMRLVYCLVGALACGFGAGAGWLLTRRRWGGYLAGLLMAVYPVTIFYSTELLVEGLATFYVSVFIFLVLWQRERLVWWRSILLGLTIGLCTITRTNLALIWFAWVLWLFISGNGWRRAATHTMISLVTLAAAIAPVTLYNLQAGNGKFQLITEVGAEEIYRANSRDSDGTYMINVPAARTVDKGYEHALLVDIGLRPARFIELQLRKLAIYWSDSEPGNNIDYYLNGENVSPLLRAVPLDFRILSALGLLGLALLVYEDRRMGIFFIALNAAIFVGVMVIWVVSRVRLPAIVPLILTTAYLLVRLADFIRYRDWRPVVRCLAPAAIVLAAVFLFCNWAINNLPNKTTITALPPDARLANIPFDNGRLRLVGWRFLNEWQAAELGWAQPQQSYALELFWQVTEPTEEDYEFYLAYIQDGARYVARDSTIGTISFPPAPTSIWQPGTIYSEIVGFKFPQEIPPARTGSVRLGVYTSDGEPNDPTRSIFSIPLDSGEQDVTIQSLAVFDPGHHPTPIDGLSPTNADFGDLIALRAVGVPEQGRAGEVVNLDFHWEGLADIPVDYSMFIHVMDAEGNRVGGYDGLVGGALTSSTWMPGYPLYESIPVQLPEMPGTYPIYLGLYDLATAERLPVDALDNRLPIGQIVVE